jgi:hypothetical protein
VAVAPQVDASARFDAFSYSVGDELGEGQDASGGEVGAVTDGYECVVGVGGVCEAVDGRTGEEVGVDGRWGRGRVLSQRPLRVLLLGVVFEHVGEVYVLCFRTKKPRLSGWSQ